VTVPEPDAGFDRPSIPSDKRSLDRISQRELGKVAVSLRTSAGRWIPARLWDFSSIGFGILVETPASMAEPVLTRPDHPEPNPRGLGDFRIGEEVQVRLEVRPGEKFETWCQIKNVASWKGSLRIGLRRLDVNFPQPVGRERRALQRLALTAEGSLKARVRHPFLFGHWSGVAISDINRDLGFSCVSTDPSILLFEGMELRIHFELPSFREMPVTALVTWVHATRDNEVKFGVACLAMDWRLQRGICDFLLYAGHWSPTMLRSVGFRSRTVKGHLRYRTVKSMEEYAEVLQLRRTAYVGAGKRPETTAPEDMATPLDGISRILTARHHERLIGSMTFTFPQSEDTLLDSEAGFPLQKYPVRLPPKANLIEVSRLCVHPDYRGTDLLQGLFEHGLKHFLMSDRHWLLTSATADLIPMYEEIGFTRLKASYRHPLLGNKEHTLLIAHRSAFLWGFGIGVLTWNSVFGDLVRHLVENRLVRLPGWMRTFIRAKLLLRPLAKLRSDAKARKAFRKHLESLKRRRFSQSMLARPDGGATAPVGDPLHLEISEGLESSLYRSLEMDVPTPKDRVARPS
jgi:predicted GNAT family N-acyltransferase